MKHGIPAFQPFHPLVCEKYKMKGVCQGDVMTPYLVAEMAYLGTCKGLIKLIIVKHVGIQSSLPLVSTPIEQPSPLASSQLISTLTRCDVQFACRFYPQRSQWPPVHWPFPASKHNSEHILKLDSCVSKTNVSEVYVSFLQNRKGSRYVAFDKSGIAVARMLFKHFLNLATNMRTQRVMKLEKYDLGVKIVWSSQLFWATNRTRIINLAPAQTRSI